MSNIEDIKKDMWQMFYEESINYANANTPELPEVRDDEKSDDSEELNGTWLLICGAYQQAVKDVLDFMFKTYDIKLTEAKQKIVNELQAKVNSINYHNECARATLGDVPEVKIEDFMEKPKTDDFMGNQILTAYKYINEILVNMKTYTNDQSTRDWVTNRLIELIGYKTDIICNETNNPSTVVDNNVLVARIHWRDGASIKYQDLYFGEPRQVLQYKANEII
jgi:hypothetical protein